MSKNVAMFIDVANLYYAARGQDVDVDYVALLKHATKGRDLIRAYAYSGLDPENENQRKFIDFLAKNGYKVLTKDIRKFGDGRVKANLDIELVVDLFRLADRMDIAVIVSGDGDFAPAIRALQDKGVRCEVISFKPNTSSDLIAVADEFLDIMKIAGIGRGKGIDKGMSAPEMPAKEVTPEFGFREASPSVAAAALAAIKTGTGATSRGAGRARGGRRAVADEPAAVTVAERAAGDEEPRRRRRRRGGRGRGRGRGTQEETAQPGAAPVEWDELDDLSQLEDLGEDREYSFQDADEETLRELGIEVGPGEAAPSAAEALSEERGAKPGTRRAARRTPRTPKDRESDVAVEADEPQPRVRRRRTPAAGTEKGADESSGNGRRRRTATKAGSKAGSAASKTRGRTRRPPSEAAGDAESGGTDASTATPESGDQPQGIWGRFRSGRGSRSS